MVTHPPENVTHTRPLEPKPCRVTITVARSPSGVKAGNVALNISSGVLTAHHQETVCGIQIMKAPAGPLVRPRSNLILSYGHLTRIAESHPATPDRASAVAHPTSYGTVGSDHRHWLGDGLGAHDFGGVGCSGGFEAGPAQPIARCLPGSWLDLLGLQSLAFGCCAAIPAGGSGSRILKSSCERLLE